MLWLSIFKTTMETMMQRIALSAASLLILLPSTKAFVISTSTTTVATCCCSSRSVSTVVCSEGTSQTDLVADNRLDFLCNVGVMAVSTVAGFALSPETSNAEVVTDDVLGFKFETPEGWERADAQISGRRKVIVYANPKNPGSNAFVAYTPVRGDFTTLGSFGTLDEVSKTILPQAQGVTSRMVDSYTDKKAYVYDYIVDQEGRPEKHIKTMWMLFPEDGQLVTITAQCDEADYPSIGKAIDKIIASIAKK